MKLVVGNFKMNLNNTEINEYISFFKDNNYSNVIFAPSYIYLERFINNDLKVASQDIAFEEKGAFTGDISASQLKSIGVNYTIIGHSERRKYYDDNKYVNEKIKCSLNNHIVPILCVGETKEERDNRKEKEVIENELDTALKSIDKNLLHDIIIAYEPIWSIGTGIIPTNEEILEVISFIKDYLLHKYNINSKVLYGGSVNNNCIDELEKISGIDGYLVGGCSIKKDDFKKLVDRLQ